MSEYNDKQKHIRNLKTPPIETWSNMYPDKICSIHIHTPELTAVCPRTGQPDFGDLDLYYTPTKSCIELKSFKIYLQFFRDIGIFHEHLAHKILEDVVNTCHPQTAKVIITMKPRGGITTTVSTEFSNESFIQ